VEFKDGTNVITSEGKEAGSLSRVVINPDSKEITHIVIQKGLLFKEDKVIAVNKVAAASPEKIILNCTADEIKEMAPLNISEYVPQNYDSLSGDVFWNPVQGPTVITQIKRTISEELIALKEGARVISSEGAHVGHVEQVLTDPETGRVNQLIISHGLLTKTRKSLPIEWVKMLDDNEILLNVGAHHLDELPEYRD
jgi:sporulation protein YlmC with PRC-barrel domain